MAEIYDGLEALRCVMSLREIASLIERTAQWVSPEMFKLLPLWFPEHGRRTLFFKKNWSAPQLNTNRKTGLSIHKSEGNVHANKALTLALGLRSKQRPNWSCCHIWGIDDASHQLSNEIVMDRRFFSCVANMVLLPTPLKAFTDTMSDVKAMLRICARNLYGWPSKDHEFIVSNALLDKWSYWDSFHRAGPGRHMKSYLLASWSYHPQFGFARRRDSRQFAMISNMPAHTTPRAEVKAALAYWKIEL